MNEQQNILDKIKKLLAKGNDKRNNIHESALALAMAQRLIEQYKIDEANLFTEEAEATTAANFKRFIFGDRIPTEFEKATGTIASYLDVEIYKTQIFSKLKEKYCKCIEIFGTKKDIELAEFYLFFLADEMKRLYHLEKKRHTYRTKALLAQARAAGQLISIKQLNRLDFYEGFCLEINKRLHATAKYKTEQANKSEKHEEKRAIVIATKKDAIAIKFKEIHPTAKVREVKKRLRRERDIASFLKGTDAAKNTQLNQPLQ